MQTRLGNPPTQTHQAVGVYNHTNHEMNQGIGPIYTKWIGPVRTHSVRKGLFNFAYILSTPGHAFDEKTSTRANTDVDPIPL